MVSILETINVKPHVIPWFILWNVAGEITREAVNLSSEAPMYLISGEITINKRLPWSTIELINTIPMTVKRSSYKTVIGIKDFGSITDLDEIIIKLTGVLRALTKYKESEGDLTFILKYRTRTSYSEFYNFNSEIKILNSTKRILDAIMRISTGIYSINYVINNIRRIYSNVDKEDIEESLKNITKIHGISESSYIIKKETVSLTPLIAALLLRRLKIDISLKEITRQK